MCSSGILVLISFCGVVFTVHICLNACQFSVFYVCVCTTLAAIIGDCVIIFKLKFISCIYHNVLYYV